MTGRHDLSTAGRRAPILATVAVVLVLAITVSVWTRSVKPLSLLFSVSVGDHFTFGRYPQGENGEAQPIEWRVLDVKDGKALVISEKLLDCVPYHETETDVTWETCTLRQWMNRDFLSEAFSAGEQKKIASTGGNAAEDKIFALSKEEAEKYFHNDDDRTAAPSDFVNHNGTWVSEYDSPSSGEKTGCWWLRSPGHYPHIAALVDYYGRIYLCGNYVNSIDVAVRPAMWILL